MLNVQLVEKKQLVGKKASVKDCPWEKWYVGKMVNRKFGMAMPLSEIHPSELCQSEILLPEKSRGT